MSIKPEIISPDTITGMAEELLAEAQVDQDASDRLAFAARIREDAAQDVRRLSRLAVCLPQMPDAEATAIYERVLEAEERVIGSARRLADYGEGTADQDDAFLVAGNGPALLEAQHATDPVRKATGRREAADHGTGGLGIVLAEDGAGRIIVPNGRQTGNANVDANHPVKQWLLEQLETNVFDRFFSVHGMRPGKVTHLEDLSEIHAVVGLGLDPSVADFERAERLVQRAKDELGLRLVIGNVIPHLNFKEDPDWDGVSFRDWSDDLERDKHGALGTTRVAAMMPNSTVTFMRQHAWLPSSQLEISRSLRLMPKDAYRRRDPKAEAYGVFLGYQVCRLALEV